MRIFSTRLDVKGNSLDDVLGCRRLSLGCLRHEPRAAKSSWKLSAAEVPKISLVVDAINEVVDIVADRREEQPPK